MGNSKVISCSSCCRTSEQNGRINLNHGRFLCLHSHSKDNTIQEKRRFWSDDEMYVIHRQIDFLSMHTKGYPQADKSESCDQANGGVEASGKELICQPDLPDGWEQCLDLETGECFYIDKTCGKRTKRDPRPILVEANQNMLARKSTWCSQSKPDSTSFTSSMHILSAGMVDEEKVPIIKACNKCLIYFLIPREVEECPWCKTCLFGV